jgi:ABC-type amino acid transport substrate-binding protein
MKRTLKHSVITLLLTIALACHAGADQKKLMVGTSADYPPFAFIQNGKLVGFDIDLITILAKELGYTVEIKDMDAQSLLDEFENEDLDIAIGAINPTKKAMETFDFSGEYYFPKYAIIHMKNNKNLNSEKDLNGKVIGIVAGTYMESFLTKRLGPEKQIKVETFTSIDFALDSLSSREIDAILDENGEAQLIKQKNSKFTYFLVKTSRPYSYAIAFKKNSKLTDSFNEELVELRMSKQLEDLKTKWGL